MTAAKKGIYDKMTDPGGPWALLHRVVAIAVIPIYVMAGYIWITTTETFVAADKLQRELIAVNSQAIKESVLVLQEINQRSTWNFNEINIRRATIESVGILQNDVAHIRKAIDRFEAQKGRQ